jgi:hypothetical protein
MQLLIILYQYRRMKQIMKKMNLKMASQYENPINILSKNEGKLFVRH